MTPNHKVLAIALGALGILILGALALFLTPGELEGTPADVPVTVSENTDAYEVAIEYHTTGDKFVDKDVAEFTESVANTFKERATTDYTSYTEAKNAGNANFEWRPYQIVLYGTTTAFTAKGASIAFTIATYTGGANMMQEWTTAIYDREEKRRIMPDQLFAKGDDGTIKNAIVWLSDTASEFFHAQYPDVNLFEEGFAPTVGNFRSVAFNKDGTASIYFDKYQIGPGAFGTSEMRLLPETFEGVFNPEVVALFKM